MNVPPATSAAPAAFVPWIVGWSGEERFAVRPCRWAGGRPAVWQPHAPGSGKPNFARPHAVRQRKAMVRGLCSVCGEWVPETERWHLGIGRLVGGMIVTVEPALHERCARIALRACPHLRDRSLAPMPIPAATALSLTLVGGPTVEADFGLRIEPGRKVVGHIKMGWRA